MAINNLVEKRNQSMGKGPLFYRQPLELVRGQGVWLFDSDGARYMDCYNNVPCVGHCHPHILKAMNKQAGLLNTHSRYLSQTVIDYSKRLMSLHAESLDVLQMVCSGTEAIEFAMRLARSHTNGMGIICSNATYHGNSHETFRMTVGPFEPDFRRVSFPDFYRPLPGAVGKDDFGQLYLEEIKSAIDGFAEDGVQFAGLLFCSLFANEGLPNIPKDYMSRAAEIVREAGGVVIFDEVQAGFCRSGEWWGYEVVDCVPDIVAMGKPMGAGYPTGGVGARAEIMESFFKKSGYFNTMAATPLQAAVANAVLDVIENEDICNKVSKVGRYLRMKLESFKERYESVGDVRGHGLFLAIDWVKDKKSRAPDRDGAIEVVEKLKELGFLISNAGVHRNVLKIRPPLVFNEENADELYEALDRAFEFVAS